MKIDQIIIEIENLLRRFQNRPHNPNVKFSDYSNIQKIKIDELFISKAAKQSKLIFDSLQDFVLFKYRIPQTRLYYQELQSPSFNIWMINYFDFTIIFVKNLKQVPNSRSILFQSDEKFYSEPGLIKVKNNSYDMSTRPAHLLMVNPETTHHLNQLPGLLEECLNHEINLHPLAQLYCQDLKVIDQIDFAWSLLPFIEKDRSITVDYFLHNDVYDFIWLQELYMHYGWFSEIDQFYLKVQRIDLNANQTEAIKTCRARYHRVSNVLVEREPPYSYDSAIEEDENKKFLNILLFEDYFSESQINKSIQNFWEFLHLPILQLYVQKYAEENGDNLIAFALLALQRHFWWFPQLEKKLTEVLTDTKRTLFLLLIALKTMGSLNCHKRSVIFSNHLHSSCTQAQSGLLGRFFFKTVQSRKNEFTYLQVPNTFYLSIDKRVDFEVEPDEKSLKICPIVIHPAVNETNFNFITMEIATYKIWIPLIWPQFKIEFGGTRLKFLRKLKRYQITLKFNKNLEKIVLNNNELSISEGLYQKHYIPVVKREGILQISAFNKYGSKIKALPAGVSEILLQGFGIDSFGILPTQARMSINESPKNIGISLNDLNPYYLNRVDKKINLNFHASRGLVCNLTLSSVPGFGYKLLYSGPSFLHNYLVMYLDEEAKNQHDKIISICRTKLCFLPKIRDLADFNFSHNQLVIIISNQILGKVFEQNEIFSLINFPNQSKLLVLKMTISQMDHLFSELFYERLNFK